jgi:hypothetical protein
MALVVSRLAAAIGDLNRADKHTRGQIACVNSHLLKLLRGPSLERSVNINALANRRGRVRYSKRLVPRKICSA